MPAFDAPPMAAARLTAARAHAAAPVGKARVKAGSPDTPPWDDIQASAVVVALSRSVRSGRSVRSAVRHAAAAVRARQLGRLLGCSPWVSQGSSAPTARVQPRSPPRRAQLPAQVERALSRYLLERLLDKTQGRANLTEEEATRVAVEELDAMRRERDAAA
jgi:hypothetical protein